MAWIQKKSGRYYAYFSDQDRTPKSKCVTLDATRKRVAEKRLELLVDRYYAGEYDPWTDRRPTPWKSYLTVGEAKEKFLKAKEHLRPRTYDTYEQQLEAWTEKADLPPTMNLQDVCAEDLRPYVWSAPASSTKAKRYRHMRVFFNWAVEEGHIKSSPLEGVERPKAEKKKKAFLSRERGELEKLIRKIEEHAETTRDAAGRAPDVEWLIHAILITVCTGLRRRAIARLRWQSVDLEGRFLHLRNHETFRSKSGHERSIPLRSHALELLRKLKDERDPAPEDYVIVDRDGKPVRPNRITRRFSFFVDKAGLDSRLTFHRLRDTFASWLAEDGASPEFIRLLAGHSTLDMTQQYMHLRPDALGAVMDQTFGGDGVEENEEKESDKKTEAREEEEGERAAGK